MNTSFRSMERESLNLQNRTCIGAMNLFSETEKWGQKDAVIFFCPHLSVMRFMGRGNLQSLDANRDHEPRRDELHESLTLVGGKCSRASCNSALRDGWFMESFHDLEIAHWDHELRRDELHESPTGMGGCQNGPRVTRPSETGRFMERFRNDFERFGG